MIPTASPATTAVLNSRAVDRSLGPAAGSLRKSIENAIAGSEHAWSTGFDRGPEIYAGVSAALHKAGAARGMFVSPDAFSRTIEFLNSLPDDIPLPAVVVESENEIGLDWDEGSRRVVSLTIRDTPMVGYAALFGAEPMHGRTPFAGELPETLRFLLARLFPHRGRNVTRAHF